MREDQLKVTFKEQEKCAGRRDSTSVLSNAPRAPQKKVQRRESVTLVTASSGCAIIMKPHVEVSDQQKKYQTILELTNDNFRSQKRQKDIKDDIASKLPMYNSSSPQSTVIYSLSNSPSPLHSHSPTRSPIRRPSHGRFILKALPLIDQLNPPFAEDTGRRRGSEHNSELNCRGLNRAASVMIQREPSTLTVVSTAPSQSIVPETIKEECIQPRETNNYRSVTGKKVIPCMPKYKFLLEKK